MLDRISIALAVVLGLAAVANGIFMLVSPAGWYFAVPGVTTTGPFNQHFVRDIGLIFLLLGGAFLLGAMKPSFRVASWGAAAVWLSGHALFHYWEVAVGICGPSAILRDFPAVSMPAFLAILITAQAARRLKATSPRSTQGDYR